MLEKDNRWDAFQFTKDHVTFCKRMIPDFYLKDAVHQDVKNSIKVVEKLVIHSYYEYEFYDLAALKALLTFEMALKLRYREITLVEWPPKKSLKTLINWFAKQNYFEVYNEMFLRNFREVRNLIIHSSRHSYSGGNKKQWLLHTLDLINDIYEDVELRKKRMYLNNNLNRHLNYIVKNGAVLVLNGKEQLTFEAKVGFINNKSGFIEYEIYFLPTFDIPENFNEKLMADKVPLFKLIASSFERERNAILFYDSAKSNSITLKTISDENAQKDFSIWKQKYDEYTEASGFDFYFNLDMTAYYEKSRRDFHKQ